MEPPPATDFESAMAECISDSSENTEVKIAGLTKNPPDELNSGQTAAFKKLLRLLWKEDRQMASLLGAAGTGKTFLVGRIVEALTQKAHLKVLAVAPTHQAVGQLEKLYDGNGITVNTIQSALGLQLQRDHKGDYELVPSGEPDIGEFDLVIADEASMVGEELWEYVEASTHGSDLRWLFVGDPHQLSPIDESPSPALKQPGVELDTIVRQTQNNPIIRLATQVRKGGSFYPLPEETTNGGLGIYEVRHYEATEKAARALDKNPTGTRLLAWRNDTVEKWTRRIRNALYPDSQRFEAGMHFLAQSTYNPGEFIKFHTSALLKVEEARKTDTRLGEDGPKVPAWSLDVVEEANQQPHTGVLVPRGQGEQVLDDYTEKMAEQEQWARFYEAREQFAELRYSASTTVHKSQGANERTVFCDVGDLAANPDPEERRALEYVACTRASDVLVLIR